MEQKFEALNHFLYCQERKATIWWNKQEPSSKEELCSKLQIIESIQNVGNASWKAGKVLNHLTSISGMLSTLSTTVLVPVFPFLKYCYLPPPTGCYLKATWKPITFNLVMCKSKEKVHREHRRVNSFLSLIWFWININSMLTLIISIYLYVDEWLTG